ncbi:hypothetical protein [Nocardia sp. NPDC050406]|uniref:hypothetical protein n=1 Tax=Nocardia sp. NPDC050406 TaxID=3364318 RepID=UPI0037A34E19
MSHNPQAAIAQIRRATTRIAAARAETEQAMADAEKTLRQAASKIAAAERYASYAKVIHAQNARDQA